MTEDLLIPARVWKTLTPAQRLTAAAAFWRDDQARDDQTQAVLLISKQKKFRVKSVRAFDIDHKARHLASMVNLPDALAARALVAYHLAERRPMMGAFLDALGIAHENGLIQVDSVTPDAAKIPTAAAQIAQQYPAAEVSLYLNTLLCRDPEVWGALRGLPSLSERQ